MKPIAYVGITGFKEEREVRNVAQQYLKRGFLGSDAGFTAKNHKAMFGFLCSAKRLADKSRQGRQSPRAQDLGYLTRNTPRGVIPMVHYHTTNRRNLAEEVNEVFSIDGMYENNYCRGIQINMPWPDIDQIVSIRREFPEMDIVLQLPKTALAEAGRAKEYCDLVQYCLIDPSSGKGQEITYEHLGLVGMLQSIMPNTRIGIAGGLSGANVEKVMGQVYQALGEPFCIDSQGKLRSEDKYRLDLNRTDEYIVAAANAIRVEEKS